MKLGQSNKDTDMLQIDADLAAMSFGKVMLSGTVADDAGNPQEFKFWTLSAVVAD